MTHLLQTVLWQRLDQPAFEICRLWQQPDSWRLEGTVLMAVDGAPAQIDYEVLCNTRWETGATRVALTRGSSTRTLELRRDEHGRWRGDGEPLDDLDGTTDVDLSFTPATNTLPIRRLSLDVGASASVSAAWLKLPEMRLEVLEQRYTRLDGDQYRYENAGGAFVAELIVDEHGLVASYGEWWKRVAAHQSTVT